MRTALRPSINIVVLVGRVRAAPVMRTLADGAQLVTFDLVTSSSADDAATANAAGNSRPVAHTVPVAWRPDAGSDVPQVQEGDLLVVVGSVARRFFRSGGTTLWRTDVVADHVAGAPSATVARRRVGELEAAALGMLRGGRIRSRA